MPVLFNVTLHATRGFEYLDQGILKLDQEDGLPRLELMLSELGKFEAFAGSNSLDFGRGTALCVLDMDVPGNKLKRFEAVLSTLNDTLCLSGLGMISAERNGHLASHDFFMVGYALQ